MSANTYGRQVVVPLTNKRGSGVIAGDVVVVDTTNNDSFTTNTAGSFTGVVGVAQATIANNAVGPVLLSGYAALVNVNASVTRGNFGKTYTVAAQATDAGASRVVGAFCQFLTGGTTPDAHLFGVPDLGTGSGNYTSSNVWTSGTSMPGGPATNQRITRTDLGLDAYYDGTRWLTTNLFSVSFPLTEHLNNQGTTAVNLGRLPIPYKGTYSVYGDSFDWYLTTGGTYSGSVYWSLKMNWSDVNDSDTQWGSTTLDTKADTGGVSHNYTHNGSIATVLNASAVEIKARADPTGSPAQLIYTTIILNYRLILT